jgi:predicted secreted Zn-dependent protease
VKENWDGMYKALEKHEKGHAEIFERGLQKLKAELENLGEIGLDDLKRRIANAGEQWQKESDEYDNKTEHGKKDGVPLIVK